MINPHPASPRQSTQPTSHASVVPGKRIRWTMALLLFSLTACSAPNPTTSDEERVVREFAAAFNAHDPEAMSAYLAEDAAWMSVMGDTLWTEAQGSAGITSAMEGYFASIPDARSVIESVQVLVPFATVIERAEWNGGESAQRAVAVYEIHDGLIERVWYHAAVR